MATDDLIEMNSIELRITEGHLERAVPHQLFDHLQRGAGIEELGSKGMPKRVGRIVLGDPRQLQVAGHAIADLPGTERQATLPGHTAREDIAYRGGLELLPLPEGCGDIRRQIDDPIHLPFTVVHA